MNLKEKLEEYMRNKTCVSVGVMGRGYYMGGKIEEVGDDYMVLRRISFEVEESWFSSKVKQKPIGTTTMVIQFANLQITPTPNAAEAEKAFREAIMKDEKGR